MRDPCRLSFRLLKLRVNYITKMKTTISRICRKRFTTNLAPINRRCTIQLPTFVFSSNKFLISTFGTGVERLLTWFGSEPKRMSIPNAGLSTIDWFLRVLRVQEELRALNSIGVIRIDFDTNTIMSTIGCIGRIWGENSTETEISRNFNNYQIIPLCY